MLQAIIKKLDGTKLDHGNFETEEAAMDWFQSFIDKGVYGQKYIAERFEDFKVLVTPAVYEEREILDENQQSFDPAQFEQVETTSAVYEIENRKVQDEVLADFTIEFTDVTNDPELKQAKDMADAKKEIERGVNAIAVFKVRTKTKNLSNSQIGELFSDAAIGKIISTLSTGSLPLAVALIGAFVADGVLVTEADKTAMIAELQG
ncbi:MAG: hypothetical protein H0X02_11380 [Nitrosomonas sp.]|nr:hypothetical protein [Nitrosomonas sp.]